MDLIEDHPWNAEIDASIFKESIVIISDHGTLIFRSTHYMLGLASNESTFCVTLIGSEWCKKEKDFVRKILGPEVIGANRYANSLGQEYRRKQIQRFSFDLRIVFMVIVTLLINRVSSNRYLIRSYDFTFRGKMV